MNRWLKLLLMVPLLLAALPSRAELHIEVVGGVAKPMPVAVVPFGWQRGGAAPFDVEAIRQYVLGEANKVWTATHPAAPATPGVP